MLAVGLHMFYNQTTALIAVCDAHVNLMAGTLNIKSLLSFLLHYPCNIEHGYPWWVLIKMLYLFNASVFLYSANTHL